MKRLMSYKNLDVYLNNFPLKRLIIEFVTKWFAFGNVIPIFVH